MRQSDIVMNREYKLVRMQFRKNKDGLDLSYLNNSIVKITSIKKGQTVPLRGESWIRSKTGTRKRPNRYKTNIGIYINAANLKEI